MAVQNVSDAFPARGAGPRTGSIGLVLLVALILVAATVGLLFVGRGLADQYILGMLAALAVVGVFSLFAGAAGILRLASAEPDPLRSGVAEGSSDGILVTDYAGRVLYANPAAGKILGHSREELLHVPLGRPIAWGETAEITVHRPGGKPADVEMRVVEVAWDGKPALLASLRDISARRA